MSSSREIGSFLRDVRYILEKSESEKSSGYDVVAKKNCYDPTHWGRMLLVFTIPPPK